jgi:hypothetical protein
MWSQDVNLQVALSGRLSVYSMSGSAPRFGHLFTCAGSVKWPRQLGLLMGTRNSGSMAVSFLFATRFSSLDANCPSCAIRRSATTLRGQAEF